MPVKVVGRLATEERQNRRRKVDDAMLAEVCPRNARTRE
jgi:hypothetical protein